MIIIISFSYLFFILILSLLKKHTNKTLTYLLPIFFTQISPAPSVAHLYPTNFANSFRCPSLLASFVSHPIASPFSTNSTLNRRLVFHPYLRVSPNYFSSLNQFCSYSLLGPPVLFTFNSVAPTFSTNSTLSYCLVFHNFWSL